MSLYPEPDTQDWRQLNNDCIANMKSLIERYNTPVMMCELGIYWNYEEAEEFFTDFMTKAKEIDQCLGVFTWEPQSYGGWKGYHKGLFDDTGNPPAHLMLSRDKIIESFFITLPRIQNILYLKSKNEHETPKTVISCTFDGRGLHIASATQ